MSIEMLVPRDPWLAEEKIRALRRVEFRRLASEGFFENERVELLFGMVVEMSPPSPEHNESVYRVHRLVDRRVGDRAQVRCQLSFAASDVSEPLPDVFVVPNGDYWKDHPTRAHLVIEVSRASLQRDKRIKRKLYALAEVEEYWIVNHVDDVVEVYRDPDRMSGQWGSTKLCRRGESVAMLAFPDVAIPVDDILPPA